MCRGIHYSDYRAVGRCVVSFERERSFFASAPKHKFADSRTNRVQSDRRLAFWLEVGIKRLNDQKLSPIKRFVLYGGNYGSYNASKLQV